MTVIVRALVPSKFLENSQTTQYTAASVSAIIDKFTVTNTSGGAVTFSVNLVNTGGSSGSSNLFIPTKTLQSAESYACPEVVGQVLRTGDFISTTCNTATAVACRVSGREIS